MDIDASVGLARVGVAVPSLEKLGRQGFPGFESEGEEALQWWRRLRSVSDQSGWWPVLLDDHAGALSSDGAQTGAAEPPVIDEPSPDVFDKELERWPEPGTGTRLTGFHLPFEHWIQEPRRVMVALLPVAHGWLAPSLIGYGGWNTCPPAQVHAAILKRWQSRYGAELVCLTRTGLELGLSRPPGTRQEALAFAWDYATYCYDGVEAIYQADTLAGLAAGLIDANVVRCWWD